MRYSIPKAYLVLLIFVFWIVWLAHSASAYEFHCSNNTLKDQGTDDTEWVEFGSGDIAWKTTSLDSQYSGTPVEVPVLNESEEYESVPYVIKVNDFYSANTMADISLARAEEGAESIHEILSVNNGTNETEENSTEENQTWCQIDHELKVELTSVTEDSQGTPHAQLKYYKRGNPKLEISIEPSTETRYNVTVGTTNYFPGKEKDILIRVKNTGEAWADSIILDIDLEGFSLSGNKTNISENSQISDKHISRKLDWIAKGEERTVNFTVVAPSWDKTSSPFNMSPCNITVNAIGNDILGYQHKASNNLSCTPVSPEPEIEVSQQLYTYTVESNETSLNDEQESTPFSIVNFSENDEICMSSWYLKDLEVRGLKSCWILRESFHNLEDYRLNNLSFELPTFPDGLFIAGIHNSGEIPTISGDGISPSGGELSIDNQGNITPNTLAINFPKSISGKKSYYVDCILLPIHPDNYELGTFSVSADCYGRNLTKTSEAATLKAHGCQIVVNKSIETSGNSNVNVDVTVKNYGDRAASVSLIDRIPPDAGFVPDNISVWRNGQQQNTSIPLKNWELNILKEKKSTSISLAFSLQPTDYYDLKYSLQPENLSNFDLPYAKANFTEVDFEKGDYGNRNYYKGIVYSSFFKSGAEVKQTWDYYENRWKVTSDHWNASTGEWEDNWDPIANRWTNETISVSNNTSVNDTELGNNSAITLEPPKEKSTLDKIMDFIFGLLPWGKKALEQSNLSEQPAQNNSGNESALDGLRNFVRGLIPGGKQSPANNSSVPSPSNNQSSGD